MNKLHIINCIEKRRKKTVHTEDFALCVLQLLTLRGFLSRNAVVQIVEYKKICKNYQSFSVSYPRRLEKKTIKTIIYTHTQHFMS